MGNKFGWRSGAVKAKSIEADSAVIASQTVTTITSAEGPKVYFGGETTRADVLAATTGAEVGSVYFSTAGKAYIKVADSAEPAETDWQKVTSSAAD